MFIVLLTGSGEGCDYCIDCNKTFISLKAETWDEAEKEVGGLIKNYGDGESAIAKAHILKVIDTRNFDIKAFREAMRKNDEAVKQEKELKEKRAVFEKLKKEFEV